jgi:lipopolysaccharide/colanic/teichoic acid biosynthesis glycosyltransferase
MATEAHSLITPASPAAARGERMQSDRPRATQSTSLPLEKALDLTAAAPLELVVWNSDLDLVREALQEELVPRPRAERLSRAVNAGLALVALVCLLPVFILIALAIKLTSRGPVFYSQVRVGVDRRSRGAPIHERRVYDLGGAPFTLHKFRTMHVNAESDGRAVWAGQNDRRVTAVGRVLRRTRLDELPQLYNVLRGEMNIVGPRPERPTIFADLRETIPHYPMRQRVKPGITGLAQILQPYDACVDDVRRKVEYDLDYMRKQSLVGDLKIMTMTVPVMLFGRGAR